MQVVPLLLQSRTQSPQASWLAGGCWERLWGNGKKLIEIANALILPRLQSQGRLTHCH